ncbi:tRNA lysidine(34) synthetase TilS [Pseudomonas sp. M30-35]|uniref:tRNA lysidine(34) synthetase TilS n=1 Tax=Pseudomonas sp. M30-35 TaxID=1981174 RepID=UPI000B3CCBF2|nr:tRNA lysidine(34) synthetase TilS [Pseudomonas sp. M30-35]ARU89363.1 tRNA lysidine(34) synthetase TilS [Pseudomonas sp. M30-35]
MSLIAKVQENLAPWRQSTAWKVAFSGGLDSTVLLHILASLAQREIIPPLFAVHIHHGLQPVGDAWPEHCQQVCNELALPLKVVRVSVAQSASLEQAARDARYAAFAAELATGELLLVAQHADDQAETLLFRLLRGAGVRGLAGMPVSRQLGRGSLLRPLLNCSQAELRDYAIKHQLRWIEDPSNIDEQYSRNFLRRQIMPMLSQRWPQAASRLSRATEHLREAAEMLDELAVQDLAAAQGSASCAWLNLPSLGLAPLRELSQARQRNALRYWLRELTPMPDTEHWAGWCSLRDAAVDAAPIWRLAAGEVHRADERLWWLSGEWLQQPAPVSARVVSGMPLTLPGNGCVRIEGQLPAGDWSVVYRQGGEIMNLPGRGRRDLKRLLNEQSVAGFIRGRLPLLIADGQLVAVANTPQLCAVQGAEWRFVWDLPTSDLGLS